MAVGNRDPRDVSTILRVLFFMGVCVRMKNRGWNHIQISFFFGHTSTIGELKDSRTQNKCVKTNSFSLKQGTFDFESFSTPFWQSVKNRIDDHTFLQKLSNMPLYF